MALKEEFTPEIPNMEADKMESSNLAIEDNFNHPMWSIPNIEFTTIGFPLSLIEPFLLTCIFLLSTRTLCLGSSSTLHAQHSPKIPNRTPPLKGTCYVPRSMIVYDGEVRRTPLGLAARRGV
ncbi:hypothetical protein KSP40_PGU004808 [Platanthera guangdongensis]|uniref:NADH-plastoquinone oxidoreductase subunit K n=1 Tax=Platanthera guangdongensis TaxID=2320717 RepID=A0ABR2MY57_9ASPA